MLHTINKSPFERDSLDACLRLIDADSPVLFIEDGVLGTLDNTSVADQVKAMMADRKVYALQPDLDARGVCGKVIDGIELVDYAGFVDLVVEHGSHAAWL